MSTSEYLTSVTIILARHGCRHAARNRAAAVQFGKSWMAQAIREPGADCGLVSLDHKIHHSRELAETNSNYGNVLTLYDRLLGTFTPSERAYSVVYGLDDADPVRSPSFPAC